MGLPEPARRKRRLSVSERGASKKSEPEPGPSEATPKQFKPGGKDIQNLQRMVAEARKVPPKALETPKQKTFHSSVYGQSIEQEKKEKAEERKELKLGGKGLGKRGQKSIPKKNAGRARVITSVAARREGWQDPEVVRALTGGKLPGAISETDSDAVVPHSARIKRRKEEKAQQVPANQVVQATMGAAQQANNARKDITKPPKKKRNPGVAALQEIGKQQKEVKCLIPLAPFLRLVQEIGLDYKADLRWQSAAVMALREAADMYLIGVLPSCQRTCI